MQPERNDIHGAESVRFSKWIGITALALLFVASVTFTVAYATHLAQIDRSQAASAAAPELPFPSVHVGARAAVVRDLTTGRVLYAKNVDAQLPLASLTKVALVLAVADVLPPDSSITIPKNSTPTNSAGQLRAGDQWTVRDLMNYTLIASSNDGADILAAAAGPAIRAKYTQAPDEQPTLWRMNEVARALGLRNTFFLNFNGLDLSTTQSGAYGSARDVATLMSYAASSSPSLFEATTQSNMLLISQDGRATEAFNTNKALGSIPGLIIGKTGYTDLAGGNLAIVFDAGLMHPVVTVVLGSSETGRFDDMRALVDATESYFAQAQATQ